MNARTRLKRAVLRDRRRGLDGYGAPLIGPLTGFDLYLTRAYAQLHHVVTHPEGTGAYISAVEGAFTKALEQARTNASEAGA